MPIVLDVETRLDDRQARTTASRAERYFTDAGDRAGSGLSQGINRGIGKVDTSKAEASARKLERSYTNAYDKMFDAAGRLREAEARLEEIQRKSNTTNAQKISMSERVERARRAEAKATREAADAYKSLEGARNDSLSSGLSGQLTTATQAAGNLTNQMSTLGATMGNLGKFGGPIAIAAISSGLVQLAGVAASATGALGLLPGAAGAAGAAFGTLKLATLGFSDALESIKDPEKFVEALNNLSPNAQRAAQSIYQLMPAFTQLKNTAQDALFAGIGQQIDKLSTQYLPTIESLTTGIAGAFNQMASNIVGQLMTPETQATIDGIAQSITQAFQSFAPAVAPLTQAFADLVSVGSGFLPEIARGAADAATAFASFIAEARQSGQLREFIGNGLDAIKQLGGLALQLGQNFLQLAPIGQQVLPDIVTLLEAMGDVLPPILTVATNIAPAFTVWVPAIEAVSAAVNNLQAGFQTITTVVSGVYSSIKPILDAMASAIDIALGPLDETLELAARVLGISAPAKGGAGPGGGGGPMPKTGGASPADRWLEADRAAHPNAGLPPGATQLRRGGRVVYSDPAARADMFPQPLTAGGAGSQSLPDAPALPLQYTATQGLPAQIASAQASLDEAMHDTAEKRARVQQLEQSNVATAEDLQKARNDVAKAEQNELEAGRRLQDAKARDIEQAANAGEKAAKQLDRQATQLGQIGAQLDQDFGISKGLSGIAENITKFVGNLIAAPFLTSLDAVVKANPSQGGFGLMGILGAQGAFGPNYTGISSSTTGGSTSSQSSSYSGYSGYPGDAALLANVPAGRYTQSERGDLTQGLADCSSAVEDLVNLMDGRPTTGASMATGNADDWLTARGFLPGMGGPGDFRVGFNSGHMQATLPGGTPFNWGSDASAARRGIGGTGADDPAFTSHYYRPASGAAAPAGLSPEQWMKIAGAEASGNWQANTGNGFSGGLQFAPGTWSAYKPAGAPDQAWQATPEQQMAAGNRVFAAQGPGAWPATSAAHPEWFQPTGGASAVAPAVTPASTSGFNFPIPLPVTIVGGGMGAPVMPFGAPIGAPAGVPGAPAPGAPIGAPVGTPASGMGLGPAPGPMGAAGPGMAPAAGSQIGGVTPGGNAVGGGGGIGITPGGTIDTALNVGAAMFPGLGQAAATGMKLANRAIQYAGQVASIGVQGLMETFLPSGGSELANNNWITRIAGGLAGAAPAIPNMAGQKAPPPPNGSDPQQQSAQGGNTTNINVTNQRATEDGTGRDIAWHQMSQNTGGSGPTR